MTDSADAALDRIAALRASHDHLRAVVEPLTPDDLRGRSYASEWSVADVLSHIGSGAVINTMTLDAGLSGQSAVAQEQMQAVWDEWNAKTPDEQAADAIAADATLVEKIEALDADQRRNTVFAIWSGPADIGGLAASRLSEQAVHTWDVEVAGQPAAALLPETVGIVLETASLLAGFTGKPGPAGRIHVTTTAPDQEFALVLGEKVALQPWDGGESTGELTLPAEALVRLVYGRLDADHTPAFTANGVDLDQLRAVFPGF